MLSKTFDKQLAQLKQRDDWAGAQALLEHALIENPDHHWLLTQLSSALYEQRQYAKALKYVERSLAILDDCPLTLWHKAGTLEAMKRPAEAIPIYTWLIERDISSDVDPCWESPEWARNLKADCLFRLGACYARIGKPHEAEQYYRKYLDLLLNGVAGSYSVEEVTNAIRSLLASDSTKKRNQRVTSIFEMNGNGKSHHGAARPLAAIK